MRLKPRAPDFAIFLAVILLLTFGMVMVLSASSVRAAYANDNPFYFFQRQILWAIAGVVVMLVVARIDYRKLGRYNKQFLYFSLALSAALFIPGLGKNVLGATRWLNLGPASFQPSELAKLAVVIYLAYNISRDPHKLEDLKKGLGPYLLLIGVLVALLLKQRDLGTAIAICATIYLMLYVGGAKKQHMIGLGVIGIVGILAAAILEPYRMRRITGFIDPWADPLDTGFHTLQSLFALGSGGIFGAGIGQSKQKYFYLPEQHTDFIFAILGEELGWIGAVCVILLFFLLIWRGIRVAVSCPDAFGSLLALGLTVQVGMQAIINMGVVSGILPVTGITLPFISYGGSSLVFTLSGIGLLLSVSRFSR
ncbi:putative lipid II flippase FtsW [Heliobacterium gestii]|uniref:Probable peptidoglycan glycosyltransferase FtsW n=1 Tax=Heliomicrobium gestii TaxID=2699 RepID=A0A845LKL1_HELGE|nr:putative lipid II flippase FtsW [Heliomicrobium gestii]MBM7867519.1 cell division protein FtsW [Heliomicrobium gestii]MZP43933.1 putative lipid II flippase FtsW [Heliomicrobium gestii]